VVVGFPGTGIGGLFYLLLAMVMPFCELYQLSRGRSSWRRWRAVAIEFAYALGILGAMAFAALGLQEMCLWFIRLHASSPISVAAQEKAMAAHVTSLTAWWAAWVSAGTLLAVFLIPAMLSGLVCYEERRRATKVSKVSEAA
jgi:hypothetical protein